MIDIEISAENYKRNKENRFKLACSSCWVPFLESVEIYVNDVTVDSIRHHHGKCYHKLALCLPEACTCAARGHSFTWTYVSAMSIIQFACVMVFRDEIKSTPLLQKAEITFHGTGNYKAEDLLISAFFVLPPVELFLVVLPFIS